MPTGYENETTGDIQHDLAMELARPDCNLGADNAAIMILELNLRGAAIPVNCRYIFDVYARFKERLLYDVPTQANKKTGA